MAGGARHAWQGRPDGKMHCSRSIHPVERRKARPKGSGVTAIYWHAIVVNCTILCISKLRLKVLSRLACELSPQETQ
jgi:hypothetical protein